VSSTPFTTDAGVKYRRRVTLLLTLREKLVKLFPGCEKLQVIVVSAIPRFEELDGLNVADTDSKLSLETETGAHDSTITFSLHDRMRLLVSFKDPTKEDMPICKIEESSYDKVALGNTKAI
jgi:hypothetical protein